MAAFAYKRLVEQEDSFSSSSSLQLRDTIHGHEGRHRRRDVNFYVDTLHRNGNCALGKTFAKHSKRRSESLVDRGSLEMGLDNDIFNDRAQERGYKRKEHHCRGRSKKHSETHMHPRARTESRVKSTNALGGSFPVDDVLRCLLDTFAKRDVSGLRLSVGIHGRNKNAQAKRSNTGQRPRDYESKNSCPVRHEKKKHHSSSPRPERQRHRDISEEGTSSHLQNRAFYERKVYNPPASSREKHFYGEDELKRFSEKLVSSKHLKERLGRFSQAYEDRHTPSPDTVPTNTSSRFEDFKIKRFHRLDSDQRHSQHRCNKIKTTQHLQQGQRLKRQQDSYDQEKNDQHQSDPLRKTLPPSGQPRKSHHKSSEIINDKSKNERFGDDLLGRNQLMIDHHQNNKLQKDDKHHDQPSNGEQLLVKMRSPEDRSELVSGNVPSVHSDETGDTLELESGATTKTPTEISDSCGDQVHSVRKNHASALENCSINKAIQEVTKAHLMPTVVCEPDIVLQKIPPPSPKRDVPLQEANAGKDISQKSHSTKCTAKMISPPPPFSPILRKPQKVEASALSDSADHEKDHDGIEVKDGCDPQARKASKKITFNDMPITIYTESSSLDDLMVGDEHQDLEFTQCLEKVDLKANQIRQDPIIPDKHMSNLVFSPNPELSAFKQLKPRYGTSVKMSTESNPNVAKSSALVRQTFCCVSGQKMYADESPDRVKKQTGGPMDLSEGRKDLAKSLEDSSYLSTETNYGDAISSLEVHKALQRRLPVETHSMEKSESEVKGVSLFRETAKEISRKPDCGFGDAPVFERMIPGHENLHSSEIYDLKINEVYNELEHSEPYSLNDAIERDVTICNKRYLYESVETELDMFYSARNDGVSHLAEPCYRSGELSASRNKAGNERVNARKGKTESSFNGLPPKYESLFANTGSPKSYTQNLENASCGDVLVVQNDVSQSTRNPFNSNMKSFSLDSTANTNEERLPWRPERGVQAQHTGPLYPQLGDRRMNPENEAADISGATNIGAGKGINVAHVDGVRGPSKPELNPFNNTDVTYSKVKNSGAMYSPLPPYGDFENSGAMYSPLPPYVDFENSGAMYSPLPPYGDFENSTKIGSSDKAESQISESYSPRFSLIEHTSQSHEVSQCRADIPEESSQLARCFPLAIPRSNSDSPNQHRESDFEKTRVHLSLKDIDSHLNKSKRIFFQNEFSAETNNVPSADKSMDVQKSSHSGVRASLQCATNAKMMSLFSNDFGCVLSQKDIEFFDAFIRPIEMEYVSKMDPGKVAQALIKEESVVQSGPQKVAEEYSAAGSDSTVSDTEIDKFVECLCEGLPVQKEKREKPGNNLLLKKCDDLTRNEDTGNEYFWMRSKGKETSASSPFLAYEDEVYITLGNNKTRDIAVGRCDIHFNKWLAETGLIADKSIGVGDDELKTESMKQFVPGMSKSEIDLLFRDKIESLSKQLVNTESKLAKSHQDVENKLEFISRKLLEPDTKADETIRGVEDKLEVLSRKLFQTELLLAERNNTVQGALQSISKKIHEPRVTTGEVSVGTDECAFENPDTPGGSVAETFVNDTLVLGEVQESLGAECASTAKSDYTSCLSLLCATTSGVTFGYLLSLARRYAEGGTEIPLENLSGNVDASAMNAVYRYLNKDWHWSDPGPTYHEL